MYPYVHDRNMCVCSCVRTRTHTHTHIHTHTHTHQTCVVRHQILTFSNLFTSTLTFLSTKSQMHVWCKTCSSLRVTTPRPPLPHHATTQTPSRRQAALFTELCAGASGSRHVAGTRRTDGGDLCTGAGGSRKEPGPSDQYFREAGAASVMASRCGDPSRFTPGASCDAMDVASSVNQTFSSYSRSLRTATIPRACFTPDASCVAHVYTCVPLRRRLRHSHASSPFSMGDGAAIFLTSTSKF